MTTQLRSYSGSTERKKKTVQLSFLRKLINPAAPILSAAAKERKRKKERKKEAAALRRLVSSHRLQGTQTLAT